MESVKERPMLCDIPQSVVRILTPHCFEINGAEDGYAFAPQFRVTMKLKTTTIEG
jgi:hypothetical protein